MSNILITKEQINALLQASTVEDIKMGGKTTIVSLTLPNGFTIVQSSSCVDPENYDHALGKKMCMKRIEDKLWELEGYRLQSSLNQ